MRALLVCVLVTLLGVFAHAVPRAAPATMSPSAFDFKVRAARGSAGGARPRCRAQRSAHALPPGRRRPPPGRTGCPQFKQVGGSVSGGKRQALEDEEMTYRIIQTVKGSYSSLGPLQCESSCSIKAPSPQCTYEVAPCAAECKERCAKRAATMFGFRNKMCIEGCRLFCDLEVKDCCSDKKKRDEL